MRVRKLDTAKRRDVRVFVRFPFELYRECPQWVPPLMPDMRAALNKLDIDGTVVIGGAHLARLDIDRLRTEMDYANMAESARTVMTLFPRLGNARIVRFWAGIEGFTPDQIPVIGPAEPVQIEVNNVEGDWLQILELNEHQRKAAKKDR